MWQFDLIILIAKAGDASRSVNLNYTPLILRILS